MCRATWREKAKERKSLHWVGAQVSTIKIDEERFKKVRGKSNAVELAFFMIFVQISGRRNFVSPLCF